MKCFYHNLIDAVAICKNCNRGVCQECAAEVTNGIACKNRCESEVEIVNNLINRNKIAHQKASYSYNRNAIIYLLLGLISVGVGIASFQMSSVLSWYLIPTGAVLLMAAMFNYSSGKKYSNGSP